LHSLLHTHTPKYLFSIKLPRPDKKETQHLNASWNLTPLPCSSPPWHCA